ncbi:hypothetical protein [Pedobacter sp. UBA4863]|uniref:hypothetical protein n=1 Tax=Pedobacter sp. UBA4863 TaxID=1947060 RepID=UPI0025D361EF|nr:hypothetical protein [Pedobacter sp. UBA4863]
MTNKEIYRKHLENSPVVLRETITQLETIILNLAMSGELAELNDQFEENDTMKFMPEDFRSLSDYNVKLLYEVSDFLEAKRREIINVNALEDIDDLPF